jgi:hypothetical protein
VINCASSVRHARGNCGNSTFLEAPANCATKNDAPIRQTKDHRRLNNWLAEETFSKRTKALIAASGLHHAKGKRDPSTAAETEAAVLQSIERLPRAVSPFSQSPLEIGNGQTAYFGRLN